MLSKRRLSPYFLFALLLILGWVSLRIVQVFATYVLLGLFLAYLTFPGYRWTLDRVRSRILAASLMLLLLTAAILLPLAFMTVELVGEAQQVASTISQDQIDEVAAVVTGWVYQVAGLPIPEGNVTDSEVMGDVVARIRSDASDLAATLPARLLQALIGTIVLVYVLFYGYVDGQRMLAYVREILPMQEAHRDLLFHEVGLVIRAVMYGTILTSLIQGILAGLGFWMFGVPNPAFWGLLVFFLAMLPVVGAPFVWVPWGVYLLALGHVERGIGLLAYSAVFVNGIEYFLRPKLISDVAHVHPVVILLGVLGGIAVFGFAGLILGPLVLSVFVTILNLYRREFAARLDEDAEGAKWS